MSCNSLSEHFGKRRHLALMGPSWNSGRRCLIVQAPLAMKGQLVMDLCNAALHGKCVLESWRRCQQVALIYKKGDPADRGNDYPMCLLSVAYKVFARVLMKCLLEAGADS